MGLLVLQVPLAPQVLQVPPVQQALQVPQALQAPQVLNLTGVEKAALAAFFFPVVSPIFVCAYP